jgi:deazaflavin-dependent oxidoreductase (nitroreductase family)
MGDDHLFGQQHVDRYRATDGQEGYRWKRDTTILLLDTVGRKSGEKRTQPLIYREVDGKPTIVASKGGSPKHPAWFLNLRDNPEVEVQIQGDRFRAKPRVAEGEERERLWKAMTEVWPAYDSYQSKTDREIPVVVLERAA